MIGTGDFAYVLRAYSTGICSFWRYNSNNDTWTTLLEWTPDEPIPRPKSGTAMAWDRDDSIYVLFGASSSETDRTHFYRYTMSDRSWEMLSDTPHGQGAGDALTWSNYDERVYGLIGNRFHGSGFARYDPVTNSWEILDPEWSSTDDGASLAWAGSEYIYALRGEYEETVPHSDTAKYDISSGTWYDVSPIPASNGVGDGGSLLWMGEWVEGLSRHIFALSGNDVLENPGYAFYRYDVDDDSWQELESLPYPVGYYVGNRLGSVGGDICYWQGSPGTWEGGGNRFAVYDMQEPVIAVYTDKDSYTSGETMNVGLDIANLGSELPCCFALWAELPGGGFKLFMHKHDITLPSGFSYSNPSFQTFVLPSIPVGTYTWHMALLDSTTHDIIVEDTAEWGFT